MFLDRSRREDRHLDWKVRAFAVAAVFGVAGIYFEERWMTVAALVVLAAGLALRLGTGRRGAEAADDEGDADDAKDEGG